MSPSSASFSSSPIPPLEDFNPQREHWRSVWNELDLEVRRLRYESAVERLRILESVAEEAKKSSERRALKVVAPGTHRSTYRKWKQRFEAHGIEGLVDGRMPPRREKTPPDVVTAICTLRRADPDISVEALVAHVAKHHDHSLSETTVKRVLREAGLHRRRGPVSKTPPAEQHLELGGMMLVEAAAVETGYLSQLTTGLMEHAAAAPRPESPPPPDVSDRDEFGRFLPEYNERFRKAPDDAVGPGYASVEQKRAHIDPERLHLMQASRAVLERKLWALMVSPLLGSGRWDGIRVARGELLGELCGYPYMPATLDLFTRELKYLGVSPTFWEIHARTWLTQTTHWADAKSQALLFIDGTTKGIWTSLFSQATKVEQVGRVMPGLDVVAFHTGYGVPLLMATHSGRAPLVKVVPDLIKRLETTLDGAEVGRIVVIDAEANSIPFLKSLETSESARPWVTRLRPSLVENREILDRTRWCTYRDGDRVRMGVADFNDPDGDAGSTFQMRVIEIERRSKGTTTYLGASMLLDDSEWRADDLADAYFARWPNQEANFRAVNQAVGFKDVHGYGKQLVDNVGVINEMERLGKRLQKLEERQTKLEVATQTRNESAREAEQKLKRLQQRTETLAAQLERRIANGGQITPKVQELHAEKQTLDETLAKRLEEYKKLVTALERDVGKLEQLAEQAQRTRADLDERSTRRKIFQHDVELDSLFNVFKTGLVLLVTWVLKECLGSPSMDPVTFLDRIATLPARLLKTPQLEILTFEYNRRDPDVMKLLEGACERINARQLRTKSGRVLRVGVDPAPPPAKPPPTRVRTKDRFSK